MDRTIRTDAELIDAVRDAARREAAWRELLVRHTPKMLAVARSFDLDRATADDLVQTAWLRFLERAHQLRQPESLGPWLCTIVRNEARRVVTRRRAVPVADGWELQPAPTVDPLAPVVAAERATALRSAFAKLNEDCRRLLVLMMADPPMSYDEISAVLDRPRGSLGPTRQRCLDRLRTLLPPGAEGTL